jgi:hypothetical protein
MRKYEKDPKGHVWETNDNGEVDIFAYEAGDRHNGPRCAKCGYGFCHHCQKKPAKKCVKGQTRRELEAEIETLRAERDALMTAIHLGRAHLRPGDHELCSYMHDGRICNKCGWTQQDVVIPPSPHPSRRGLARDGEYS